MWMYVCGIHSILMMLFIMNMTITMMMLMIMMVIKDNDLKGRHPWIILGIK